MLRDIFQALDNMEGCVKNDSVDQIIENFDLCIYEAEIIYKNWRKNYMIPKVEVDYKKTTGGFYRGGKIAKKKSR